MSVELRQHIEKITPLTDEEFAYILSHFKTKKLRKHQFLIQEGDHVHNDHWVQKGLLKAYHTDEDGKERILQFAMEDWWITDYQAYFNEGNASIYIDCIEDAELLVLSLENREKLCNEIHGIANFFRRKSNFGFIALQQRILLLLNKNPQERYERLLQLSPQLLKRLPKTLLASYLGVSRETLSRLSQF
ncbi:cAMP-binding domain of CRP or a regulatory subunit of cAMP-dependent protein kinases [Pseudarcicella hirudinis]|uniref:cAMP-binding domain of CRP or a regulatory subunit of cAMP-dependent protein kinases n=1 Tax=Pseudarcicella hirudinis TaxID=1079859 RepID=A0A1I5RK51_9BACT|nr:Crp/Fnr family transcriptional regulator [Pseudarcicella hirudinis]SFP58760.1 cAMP-binding domain of CRP or a regulatory subunit of cAMP-dependent protein kinases [Pseudarcicella hirudinis]